MFPTVWVEKRETPDYVVGVVEEGSCMAEIGFCDLWVLSRVDEALTAEGLKMSGGCFDCFRRNGLWWVV